MKLRKLALIASPLLLACREKGRQQAAETAVKQTVAVTGTAASKLPEEKIDTLEWNMGADPDEPERSVKTRFVVHIEQSQSGGLLIRLDTATPAKTFSGIAFYPADSVRVSALGSGERFTQACKYGSTPWPTVAVISDTTYERWSRPKYSWLLDTANVRIRALPTDSASCFLAGPD